MLWGIPLLVPLHLHKIVCFPRDGKLLLLALNSWGIRNQNVFPCSYTSYFQYFDKVVQHSPTARETIMQKFGISETSLLSRTLAWKCAPLPDSTQSHQLHTSDDILAPFRLCNCKKPSCDLVCHPAQGNLIFTGTSCEFQDTWNHNRCSIWRYRYCSVHLVHYISLPASICEVNCSSQNTVFTLSWIHLLPQMYPICQAHF